MAFKRAFRSGQTARLPVLCDPDYQARRARRIAAAVDGDAERAAIDDEERRFRDTLDAACLTTDLEDVGHVLIRALPGEAFAAAEEVTSVSVSKAAIKDDTARTVRYTGAYIHAVLRRGLIDSGLDGLPVAESGEYPIDRLYGPGGLGSFWPAYSTEVYGLIHAWSHMGESAGSSCVPSPGEPS